MIPWDLPAWITYSYLFILGAVIGSFLNVLVYRLPLHEEIGKAWRGVCHPPSSCPYCRRRILAIDNVPIFGWMWLRGRCRFCQHRISFRYPFIEFLNGSLFVLLYWMMIPVGFGAEFTESCLASPVSPYLHGVDPRAVPMFLNCQFLYYLVFTEALLVASLIDFDLQIIPDSVTVPAMVVGLLGSLVGCFWLLPVWYQSASTVSMLWSLFLDPEGQLPWWTEVEIPKWTLSHPHLHGFANSIAGFVVGGGTVWYVRIAGQWVFRREAMGFGDVVLMAMIGSFLGWQPTLVVFFVAPLCALAAVLGTALFIRPREIPYGPYLSLGALIVMLGWKWIYPATERLFTLGPFLPVIVMLGGIALVVVLWVVQGAKWLLGIPLYEDEWVGEWTSADQLAFFASHQTTQPTQSLPRQQWPGIAAGQGTLQRQNWQGR
ncbi:hypothetical protein GC163_15605 [bacterium]|nr:hypothetical protein [bacterium]